MIKKELLVGAILLSTTINGMAVEWDSIIKKVDYEIFVDIDSYNVANGYPYVFTKTIFKKSQLLTINKKITTYQYEIKNTQFNCKQPQFKVTSIDFYNQKNKLLSSEKFTTTFKTITLGSDEYSVAQLACQVHQMVGGQ